jgi:pyruvate dehydrogenase E2 component (dihydrolipoamide acetyltransferase)
MPIEILMPALSPTMTEGNLARWLKKEGDEVHAGDVIAEIETDKATMEYEAVDEGRIGWSIVPEGAQGIKVNAPIAVLLEEGEDESALADVGNGGRPAAATSLREVAAEAGETGAAPLPSGLTPAAPHPSPLPAGGERESTAPHVPSPRVRGEGQGEGQQPMPRGNGEARIFASPLARRMALHAGLDLTRIRGSGPQGRIVKADIEQALAQPGAATPQAAQPGAAAVRPPEAATIAGVHAEPPPPALPSAPVFAKEQVLALAGNPPYSEKPHTAMRRVIARRLAESKQTVPHFYMSVDCAIDELLKTRAALNAKSDKYRISVNDFVVRAAALALRQVPAANASWSDDAILLWERVDISVAVALEDGLITPIVKGADRKGLAQIAAETKDLAERARAGKLKLEEFQGGTFSISNLGMYGIREFAAVINPPHGCILAIGAGETRPVVRDGELKIATVMTCTLSCDHRVVDGAVGAQFLAAFKRLIEDPLTMLL